MVTTPETPVPASPTYPIERRCPFEPPADLARLRDTGPVPARLPSGQDAWLVARHADVRAVLGDGRRFSSDRGHPAFPRPFAEAPTQPIRPLSMIGMDGAEHTAARRLVVGEFTVRRAEAMRPRIQQIVDERIDAMLAAGGPVDLVEMLSLPVPSLVICELLGVPYADHDFFQRRSGMLLRRDVGGAARSTAMDELMSYLDGMIAAWEQDPGDDLIGRQIVRRREAGRYERDELVSLAALLLIAGHETTANMISLGILALLEHPDEAVALRADPSRTPLAVEEMLRYFTIVDSVTSRVTTEAVEIGERRIGPGEGVVALGLSANHDPASFEHPDELDLDRGARHHVAFGFGPHQCLGQNLARVELAVVFDTVLRRIPGLRLAGAVDELPYKDDASIYGIYRMPVEWAEPGCE
ncbi:cytochrome P450 [Actinocatenispora thailandica]|uniref:Cytochrome P450 n=1 Tax=Actinocatenispora thailandica TaxID=227318 RepID=A0A7R7HYJ1_9ACTN|nr:cytochrome P450 [Actinocatenispora thailandica]BCJ36696.1 cytochrome P450 [Actinocatenispora thailandica]